MTGWIVFGIVALAVLWGIVTYNRFVLRRNRVLEGWSSIDVQLKRRHNLIPNLVDTVKGYTQHEERVLSKVTELRTRAEESDTTKERASQESALSKMLGSVFALAEAYPELKANDNFLNLQENLNDIEEQIQFARRYYNGTVRDMNVLVASFPSNLIARSLGFAEAEYFEIDLSTQRDVPEVSF